MRGLPRFKTDAEPLSRHCWLPQDSLPGPGRKTRSTKGTCQPAIDVTSASCSVAQG